MRQLLEQMKETAYEIEKEFVGARAPLPRICQLMVDLSWYPLLVWPDVKTNEGVNRDYKGPVLFSSECYKKYCEEMFCNTDKERGGNCYGGTYPFYNNNYTSHREEITKSKSFSCCSRKFMPNLSRF